MENLLFIFVVSLISFLALTCYRSIIPLKNYPPTPPAILVIGHFHLLKQPLHSTLQKLSQKYGSIISLRFGSRPVIVVSSPSIAQECFTQNDIVFANRPRFLLVKHLTYNYSNVVQASYGHHWRHLRRVSTIQVLSNRRLNMLGSIIKDEVKRFVSNLYVSKDFRKVEMKSKFQNLTYYIMVRIITGKRYLGDDIDHKEKEAKEFRELLKEVGTYGGTTNPRDLFPILNWIDGGRCLKKVMNLGKRLDNSFQRFIDEQRNKDGDSGSSNSLIGQLLYLQESEPDYFTDDIIKGLIQIMLFAGIETTSITLEWALTNLLNNPTILKKARDEIDNIIGEENLLEEHHLSKLPYLQNIISETLRLHPAAPLLLPHMSSDDCKVGGYDVPRGTILLVNVWAIHRDPTLWNDPTSFKPERFDASLGEGNKIMTFGLGRRSCPGVGLAQRIIGLNLGSLIQCFEWEKVNGKEVHTGESKGGTVVSKVEPLEAMCKPRPIMHKILS